MPSRLTTEDRHRFEVKNHVLSGIRLLALLRILYRYKKHVAFLYYFHRILFLVCIATFNSLVGLLEDAIYGRLVSRVVLHPEPVFILGHPRTGTTHVHNLLSLDGRFAFANTFQCGFPSTFLLLERFSWLLAPLMDKTRPIDNMRLHFNLPQEDEIATLSLSSGVSPYLQIVFMLSFDRFEPLFAFGDDCDPADKDAWRKSFLFFLKKVTYRHGGCKPLLIKSPVHTARIRVILDMFPNAKFVYCHRCPYEVFSSSLNMARKCYPYCYLMNPVHERDVLDFIFRQYTLLFDEYVKGRALVDSGSLVEVPFQMLDAKPKEAVREIYVRLGLPGGGDLETAVSAYLSELKGFRKNSHAPLDGDMRRLVATRWRDSFDAFGYNI